MKNLRAPREPIANLKYRRELREWALRDKRNRDWLHQKCADDILFFIESFCWLYEPRPEENRPLVIPFIPWEHQYEPLEIITKNLGYRDIGLEKARGEGATWLCLTIILHGWLFKDMHAYGIVSKTENSADNPDDPDSLGWKIDWQLSKLPVWLTGRKATGGSDKSADWFRNVSKHTWYHRRTGSTITGYASTGDLASGGRKFAFFMDELAKFPRPDDSAAMAATEPVTNSRLLVSTYDGAEGEYYKIMHEPSSMIKLVLDWTKNPSRNQHMFRIDFKKRRLLKPELDADVEAPDWGYAEKFFSEYLPILQRRGFDVDSITKLWSPWYVDRCLRPGMTPRKIAQEYDRDPGGSGSRFFPSGSIAMLRNDCRKPDYMGEVELDYETLRVRRFTEFGNGHLKIWDERSEIEKEYKPAPGRYVVGSDVATGHGGTMSSNSTISVVNRDTGKKVAEFADPNITPGNLAEVAIALCRWFADDEGHPAYLVWEANGAGMGFTDRVLDTNFRNFHWRTPWKTSHKKPTKEPGWWSSKESKRMLLEKYRWSLTEGHFQNPSDIALQETLCYVYGAQGKVYYVADTADHDDPSNDGENHGDRVIADALANYGREELNGSIQTPGTASTGKPITAATAPVGSFAHRQQARRAAEKNKLKW